VCQREHGKLNGIPVASKDSTKGSSEPGEELDARRKSSVMLGGKLESHWRDPRIPKAAGKNADEKGLEGEQ
jgi:hypothetical protein